MWALARARALLVAAAALATPATAEARVSVAVDLAPAHSLTALVMGELGAPTLIVPPGASPHGYAMRPSEAGALAEADLIVWLGPDAARWLADPIATLAHGARTLELEAVAGVTTRTLGDALRHGGADHANEHAGKNAGNHGGHADHGALDPHLWLDPQNAGVWLSAIAEALADLDPENAALYRANAERARADIDALGAEIAAALALVRDRPFLVFHDAYGYFEDRFDVHAVGAIALGDGARPSAARVAEIEARIAETGARCVFTEPQFDDRIARAFGASASIRVAELDPLGARLEPGAALYPALMRALTASLVGCLGD